MQTTSGLALTSLCINRYILRMAMALKAAIPAEKPLINTCQMPFKTEQGMSL